MAGAIFTLKQIRVLAFIIGIGAVMTACVSSSVNTTSNSHEAPKSGAQILLIQPDVELSLITASGLREPRADWSKQAQELIVAEIEQNFSGNDHVLRQHTLNTDDAHEVQLIKLHEAVGNTILLHRFFNQPLPSKKDKFDWSLGPGVATLADNYDADYALFIFARGAYASAARQATALVLAVAGVGVGTGDQAAFASLVNLKTGDIVWFNVTVTGSGVDMRKSSGAETVVKGLMKDNPLTNHSTDKAKS
jgi:hypothetical protein